MRDVKDDPGFIRTVTTILNGKDNGGEAVIVTTHIFDNGDYDADSRYTQTTITLESYGRSAELHLGDVFDGDGLRDHQRKLDTVQHYKLTQVES